MAWTDLRRISIGQAETAHVNISVAGEEPDDWRVATVEVACGIWRGAFRWQFYRGELRQFGREVQELHRRLSGTARLEPMEPNLKLVMVGDGRGHITVEGRAEPEFAAGAYLVFRIALDQTELPSIAAALLLADPG